MCACVCVRVRVRVRVRACFAAAPRVCDACHFARRTDLALARADSAPLELPGDHAKRRFAVHRDARRRARALRWPPARKRAHTRTHSNACTHTNACTHARMHARTHARTHTRNSRALLFSSSSLLLSPALSLSTFYSVLQRPRSAMPGLPPNIRLVL
eukprot:6175381-Pleurochrysis_carterae.AAC.2